MDEFELNHEVVSGLLLVSRRPVAVCLGLMKAMEGKRGGPLISLLQLLPGNSLKSMPCFPEGMNGSA